MSLSKQVLLPLLASVALVAAAPSHAAEEVLATVNGAKITKDDFQRFVFEATQGMKGKPKIDPNDVMSELLSRELVYQDAIKQGVDKRKEIIDELKRLERKLIVGVAIDEAVNKNPITDKELQALYDSDIKDLKLKELKARHILVKEKTQAEQIITELDLGGDFAKLAEKHSTDAGSAKKGGELGWFRPQQMVAEFSNAAMLLDKGKYTKVPVQSQFGWHIIKLEDSRDVAPPTFEQVKPKLAQALKQKRVADYIQSLEKKADIKVNQ